MTKENKTILYKISHLVLLAAIVIGTFVRLTDLGKWPLTTDEYFLGKSVYNLLAHGVPRFECGGYYTRGLLQQYLTALVLQFTSDPEWALRIVPLIFNLLGIPAVYLLGRRLGGYPVACAASVLFCLSIWETEFARFARMYAPFQTLFLWQLVFLAQAIFDRRGSALKWMYGLSAVSLFVYEGAIFLILLNLLPFLTGKHRVTWGHAIINLALLGFAVVFKEIDFRHLGALPHLPVDVREFIGKSEGGFSLPVSLPSIMLTTLPLNPLWCLLGVFPLALSVRGIFLLWRAHQISRAEKLTWLLILFCSVFNLIGLALEIYILSYLFTITNKNNIEVKFKPHINQAIFNVMIAVMANGFFWVIYGLLTDDWLQSFGNANQNKYFNLVEILLNYPDIYTKVIRQWAVAMPFLTGSIIIILILNLLYLVLKPEQSKEPFLLLIATILILIVFMSLLKTQYNSTRYTFFLYPALILLSCASLKYFGERITATLTQQILFFYVLIATFALFTEDFGIHHLKNIASPEVNFRTNHPTELQELYYARRDFSSPANYVNENANSTDIVIVFWPVFDFYLEKLDFIYMNYNKKSFYGYSACNGGREIWTNAPLLYKKNVLYDMIEGSERKIWLIMYTDNWKTEEEVFLEKKYEKFLSYVNLDKTIQVYRIPKINN